MENASTDTLMCDEELEEVLSPGRSADDAYAERQTAPAQAAEFAGPRECSHWRS